MGVSAGGENTIIDFTENVNVTIGTETVPSNNGSWGIEASSGATVNVDGLAQINIFGEDSMGLQAVSTGKIILERAIIKAVGNNTTAVLGDEMAARYILAATVSLKLKVKVPRRFLLLLVM